jgi:hypothetical protein
VDYRADAAAGLEPDDAQMTGMREEPYGHAPIAATGRAKAAEAAGRPQRSFRTGDMAGRAGVVRLCDSAATADNVRCRNIDATLRRQRE